MGMSEYFARLRRCLGHDLILNPGAAACIRDSAGRILLLHRNEEGGRWSFPGGAMDPGESIADAVVREVREETGLHVEPAAVIGVYSGPAFSITYPNGDRVQPVTILFECRVLGGELRPDQDEILEGRYFARNDELPPMYPCCVAKMKDAFEFDGRAAFR